MATKPVTYTATATFRDAEGKSTTVRGNFKAATTNTIALIDTDVLAWANLIAANSYAKLFKCSWSSEQVNDLTLPTEVPGTTDDAQDKALINFNDAAGEPYRMEIPAPLNGTGSIFLDDDETVDPTVTTVSTLVTGVTGGAITVKWATARGLELAAYIQGYRVRKHNRRQTRAGIATEMGGE